MKITALLYNPPGKGEAMKQEMVGDDSGMPVDAFSAGTRSVAAIRHFWPHGVTAKGWMNLPVGRALTVKVERDRMVVEGSHWSVEWATDAYIQARKVFLDRWTTGAATPAEIVARAEAMQAAMVCHLTTNEGVPA